MALFKKHLKEKPGIFTGITNLLSGKTTIDKKILESIETMLLTADVGIETTDQIITELNQQVNRNEPPDSNLLLQILKTLLQNNLEGCTQPLIITNSIKPYVILTVGVNGSGKTTTIAKLAHYLQQQGEKIMFAAGDTFRAAAIEQLQVWGDRLNVPVIAQQAGADSASVIYDAMQAAQARNIDVLIADTAGRLHTQEHLMEELKKVKRVTKKSDITAPHEIMLILDASIGQNSLVQAKQFNNAIGVTGITLTKLDGTAKGGIIFAIARETKIPIRFIGIGENIEDLHPFDAKEFVAAMFDGIGNEV
ncbi:MAG: cell division protein FtsY [Coxiella sp. DG_40]|nr:MAG: cell division protein FtsY [Coxiella sp. DG_40]